MFKGTDAIGPHELSLAFDNMGAIVHNASTGHDSTNYFAKVVPEYTQQTLELLAQMMRPALRTEDFEMEKNVIIEEIALYLDQPSFELVVQGMARYFGDHSLSIPVLGTPETIKGMRAEDMRAYWASHYAPSNMVVVAVGAVKSEEFVKMVEKACGAWTGSEVKRSIVPVRPRTGETRVIHKPNFSRQHLLFMTPAPPRTREWEEAVSVLTTIVGDNEHSRLYWDLVEPGLVDTASLDDMGFEDCGAYTAYVSCEPSKAPEIMKKTLEIIRAPKSFTDEELEMARNKLSASAVFDAERGVGRYYALGSDLLLGYPYRTVHEESAAYEAVTRERLEELLKAYPMTDWAVTAVGPLEKLS